MNKKLTPIWDELSAIGEAAPPGTWDNVPANLSTLIDNAYEDYAKCIAENEALKLVRARYEYVSSLSPKAFKELGQENVLRYEGTFDDLVDRLIKNQPWGGLPK